MVRYFQDFVINAIDPTIEDYYHKQVTIDSETEDLDVLELGSHETFTVFHKKHIFACDAFMYILAVDNVDSLTEMANMLMQVVRIKDMEHLPALVVCINKIDLDESQHIVTEQMVKSTLQDLPIYNYVIMKTSAKNKINITESFEEVVIRYRLRNVDLLHVLTQILQRDKQILNDLSQQQNKRKCCIM